MTTSVANTQARTPICETFGTHLRALRECSSHSSLNVHHYQERKLRRRASTPRRTVGSKLQRPLQPLRFQAVPICGSPRRSTERYRRTRVWYILTKTPHVTPVTPGANLSCDPPGGSSLGSELKLQRSRQLSQFPAVQICGSPLRSTDRYRRTKV